MTRDTRIVAWVLGTIAAGIAGSATLITGAIAQGASPQWRLLFRIFCHGIPERSLQIFGEAMPICARCLGIYGGLLLGIALFAAAPWIAERPARLLLWVAIVPLAIDGVTQAAGLRLSTNPLRIATGMTAAVAFAIWALAAVQHRNHSTVSTS